MARRRRQGQHSWLIWFKVTKILIALGAIGASAFYAYEVGQQLAREEVSSLRQDIERLTAAEAGRAEEATRLAGELAETRKRADEFQAKYQQVAPSDETKEILALVRAKLDSGLDAKRLAFVISAAERPRRCGEAATKRFMVKTAKFDGASTWVRFADLITVTADGIGGNNGGEQWFDPERPVTVHFTAIGGKEVQVSGKLPLQHAMVVKNGEYRFTIAPGARGFVEVTGDRCEYRG
ncbi:MAG: hypothetical protein HY985_14755 [Magnetospirillum sp.]|nr:hypothetical protein [Magnetospirillum sp.]